VTVKIRTHWRWLLLLGLADLAGGAAEQATAPPAVVVGGILLPSHDINVVSPVGGVIKRILVEEGDKVAKDQPLVELDAELQKVSLAMSEHEAKSTAALRAAEANVRVKQADHERYKVLHSKGVASGADLEKAEFEVKYADSQLIVEKEKQQLRDLKVKLERTRLEEMTIRAPLAGVIVRRLQDVGESAEMQKPLMRLVVLDVLHAVVYVPPALGTRLKPGDVAQVELEGQPGTLRPCKVAMVDPLVDAGSSTVRVKLELPNADGKVIAGSRASVRFDLGPLPPAPGKGPGGS
jgi:HlyD family secretion protein